MPYYDIHWKRTGLKPGQSMEDKRERKTDTTRLFADSKPEAESQWDRQYSAGGMFVRTSGANEIAPPGGHDDEW